ncbi:MAG: DKNYY domain-containing protein [Bacteroidales bacterium]|jgi:hypothetical protein|nr:DKNYY domain-containing protein [Bacteroidales bacterium]
MKPVFTILLLFLSLPAFSQEAAERESLCGDFESCLPLRCLPGGLWINAAGDVAYRDAHCCAFDSHVFIDSPGNFKNDTTFLQPVDCYLTRAYNLQDSANNAKDDYMSELKNIVDTASFRLLAPFYGMDANHVYVYQPMACGGLLFCTDLDRATFRVFDEAPKYACDKDECFAMGWYIDGADPATFRPIITEYYLLSRDKNHVYDWYIRLNDDEIRRYEDELGVALREAPLPVKTMKGNQ